MIRNNPVTLIALGAIFAGCPKGAEPARNGSAAPKAAASNGSAAPAKAGLAPDTVVATWKDGKMTYGELLEQKKDSFAALERKQLKERHDTEKQELEAMLVEKLVEKAASAKNQSPEEYFKAIAEADKVSDEDIQKFYDSNVKGRPGAPPLEALREKISGYLLQQKGQEVVKAEVDRLKAEAKLEINMPTPDALKVSFDLAGRPMKGKADAKITIVEFSDFECPYCSRATAPVEALLKAYPNDVKVYFMHFPLGFHKKAMPAAIASQCANQQGKFWELHDKIFANQSSLAGDEQLEAWAGEVGLDAGKFKACFSDPKTKAYVEADMKQGELAGVRGTPSFYINGEPYAQGVPTVDAIKPYLN